MRTLQMMSKGEDVKRLQWRLNEVGNHGLVVDGVFGSATRTAVVLFQRSRGLVDDGIAGPATLRALGLGDTPSAGQAPTPASRRRLRSLHIGVNHVDPTHYGGWDGALNGCENDARTMMAIAERDGFSPTLVLTAQATTANVLAVISAAAGQLTGGDMFLLSYAGHGAQVPNVSGDDEVDQQDETWVLYDRMLIDDELEQAFSEFAAGVHIVLISDSCHSGTVHRKMFDPAQLQFAEQKATFYRNLFVAPTPTGGSRSFPVPVTVGTRAGPMDLAVEEQRGLFATAQSMFSDKLKHGWKPTPGYASIFDRFPFLHDGNRPSTLTLRRFPPGYTMPTAGNRDAVEPVITRNMPLGVNASVVARQAALYAEIQDSTRGRPTIQANGLSLSGCQDSQLSQETGGHGVFTTTLTQTWNRSAFTGSYETFHRTISSRMGPNQTPVLSLWGEDPRSLAARTPFG